MKKILALFPSLFFLTFSVYAQTNTFPSSGHAGIGTTSPGARLHIRSEGASPWIALDKNPNEETGINFAKSGNTQFYMYTDNTAGDELKIQATGITGEGDATPRITIPFTNKDLYLVQSGGNVAIGHATPYTHSRLHIKALTAEPWGILAEASGNDRVIGMGHNGTAGIIAVSAVSGGTFSPLEFRTSNVQRLTIDVDGRIGVNTHQPSARLNILQSNGSWNAGLRLSLMGRHWDIVADSDGERLVIGKNQNIANCMVLYNGNVGIGAQYPNEKLTVNGTVYSKEIKVDLNVPGPDYVFEKDYNLPSLQETETYIRRYKHLPEVPSAAEMSANGIHVGEMNMILLKKVEELTLYIIEQNQRIESLEKQNRRSKRNNAWPRRK